MASVDDMDGAHYLLASFRGEENSHVIAPLLRALHELATAEGLRLVFGLDADTYTHTGERGGESSEAAAVAVGVAPTTHAKTSVWAFASSFVSLDYTSCWGDLPDPASHTTFNTPTYLQAQLHKAAVSGRAEP